MRKHHVPGLIGLGLTLIVMWGCGGDGEGTADSSTLDPSKAAGARGTVTWCINKDTSGAYHKSMTAYEQSQSAVKVKLLELPESADEQRTQLIQRLRAKSSECDVVGMDVTWTAEFASQQWLQDLSAVVRKRRADFIPSTLAAAEYKSKHWGIPYGTGAGFIYYRTDQVSQPSTSWEELYASAKSKDGFVYQGADYEGLTVNFLELLYSAGGRVLSDDSEQVEIDSATTTKVLEFMAEGISSGAVPKAVTTYMEEEARRAFESSHATYMRNWSYAIALGNKSAIKGKFEVATFPGFAGGKPAGVLGGFNLGISAFSKNPEAALSFVNFLSGPEAQRIQAETGTAPVIKSAYRDPGVKKALPAKMAEAIAQAKPRPASPVYAQITEAIHKNVHSVLSGDAEPSAATERMSSQIQEALESF